LMAMCGDMGVGLRQDVAFLQELRRHWPGPRVLAKRCRRDAPVG
jgi:hypothetical protein